MRPEEREELARLLPSPGEPVLSSDRHALMKDHLMLELTPDALKPTPDGPELALDGPELAPAVAAAAERPRPAARRRFALIAVPVAAAVVVAAAVLGFGGSGTPATDQEAVDLLNRIATVAAAREPVAARDDQYVYVRTQGSVTITDKDVRHFREKRWTAVDGKREGFARITFLNGVKKGPRDPLQGMTKGTRDMRLGVDPNVITLREVEALPTDPDALLRRIYADAGGEDRPGRALERIGQMLDQATLLPEAGAALYRAAARIPGVSVVENAEDHAGRSGIGLGFEERGERHVWVFDEESLTYLGSDRSALLATGVVDRIGETPGS
ncbi:CU044_5270 family protein [Streptomyces phaeochromogenes]